MEKPEFELKPCPFCGAKPDHKSSPKHVWYQILCENPDCGVNPITDAFSTSHDAIAAWNLRLPAPAPAAPTVEDVADAAIVVYENEWGEMDKEDRAEFRVDILARARQLRAERGTDEKG